MTTVVQTAVLYHVYSANSTTIDLPMQAVLKEMLDYLREALNMKAVLRSVRTIVGGQYVILVGAHMMPELCVSNWDFQLQVRYS